MDPFSLRKNVLPLPTIQIENDYAHTLKRFRLSYHPSNVHTAPKLFYQISHMRLQECAALLVPLKHAHDTAPCKHQILAKHLQLVIVLSKHHHASS